MQAGNKSLGMLKMSVQFGWKGDGYLRKLPQKSLSFLQF